MIPLAFSVMKETVEHGGGNGAIAVKDCRPLLEGFVGSDDDGAMLVALADDLEKQIGPALIYREISDLIEYRLHMPSVSDTAYPRLKINSQLQDRLRELAALNKERLIPAKAKK